ncbi:hypothetical protein UlMin_008306 [Ulmus minor]
MTKSPSAEMPAPARSSAASIIRAYSVPLVLFVGAMFYQLVVIPNSFPPSHYDVLGLKRYSSIEEVKTAYIRYAFELLTNPSWKTTYDAFGIQEQLDVLEKAKEHFAGQQFSKVDLPLLDSPNPDARDDSLNFISSKDFQSMFQDNKPWLIQLYSIGSKRCNQFSDVWKRIAAFLDGVANTASVELGDSQLIAYLAEKKSTGQPFFRNGLPSLVAFPQGCKTADCLIRYEEQLSVDAITDWFATNILGLPRIFYYSKESLGSNFLAKVSPHKVKVIIFSSTGERAAPFIRQAAQNYFEVESAPAIVFLKDPGLKPLVHHGEINSSGFSNIMEQNKQLELRQLRSMTSMELGCDAHGFSRAGYDTTTWYCAIIAGRHGPELSKMRETVRRVQNILSDDSESTVVGKDHIAPASVALSSKRLTFAWLDGEAQQRYCQFYLHSESSYETCGPRRDMTDVPLLFIVRYKRNASEENVKPERKQNSIFDALQEQELDPASQLVAKYNGSDEMPERTKTPDLVPEDEKPIWSKGAQSFLSTSTIKQRFWNFITKIFDYTEDPRIGPILLLGSLMSFGTIWLRRGQSTVQSNPPSQSNSEDEKRRRRRDRGRPKSTKGLPPSITDDEPKEAFQVPFSDSDSE